MKTRWIVALAVALLAYLALRPRPQPAAVPSDPVKIAPVSATGTLASTTPSAPAKWTWRSDAEHVRVAVVLIEVFV